MSKNNDHIKLRPHHLICNLCFQGEGYDEAFVENFKRIHQKIDVFSNSFDQSSITIEIINGCDAICAKCPKKSVQYCENADKVNKIDALYLKILDLKIGDRYSAKALYDRVRNRLTIDGFQKACKDCNWYPMNLCQSVIERFIEGGD